MIIGLEESALDNNVTAVGLDYRVTFAFSVSADSEISAFDRYGCIFSDVYSNIVTAFSAVKRSVFDRNFSIISCLYGKTTFAAADIITVFNSNVRSCTGSIDCSIFHAVSSDLNNIVQNLFAGNGFGGLNSFNLIVGNYGIEGIFAVDSLNHVITVGYKRAFKIIVTLGRILVDERAAFNSDLLYTLVVSYVKDVTAVRRVFKESAGDFDFGSVRNVNGRIAFTFRIGTDVERTARDVYGRTEVCPNTNVAGRAGTAVVVTADNVYGGSIALYVDSDSSSLSP